MTDFVDLRSSIADDLRDPDNKTFSDAIIGDMVNQALAEIGRIAPRKFQEDLDPVENQFEYQLLETQGFTDAVPEVEVYRVELWDETRTPHAPFKLIAPSSEAYVNFSSTGWHVVEGVLELPYWLVSFIGSAVSSYSIRVWGYCPYVPLSADADVVPVSNEKEWALRQYVRVLALQRLANDRVLFTQWQTRSGNTDMSFAGLLSDRNSAMEDWRRMKREITVLREAPG